MSEKYGLKEFKALMEKRYEELNNPLEVPFPMDPYSHEAARYRFIKQETLNYVLEMMPEIE